jgi:hypothetical protein
VPATPRRRFIHALVTNGENDFTWCIRDVFIRIATAPTIALSIRYVSKDEK